MANDGHYSGVLKTPLNYEVKILIAVTVVILFAEIVELLVRLFIYKYGRRCSKKQPHSARNDQKTERIL